MDPLTLSIHPVDPEKRKIARAVEELDRGAVVLYPTDTVYALGCAIDARRAIERLYRLKQMDRRRALSLICPDIREASRYAVISDYAYRQMRRLTPGPYTFLLEATREVPRVLLDKRRVMGIRIPGAVITQALVQALGRPLLTTSAIPPGAERAVTDVDEAKEAWPSGIDLFLDGDVVPGVPSTIVSLIGDQLEVVRQGLGPV